MLVCSIFFALVSAAPHASSDESDCNAWPLIVLCLWDKQHYDITHTRWAAFHGLTWLDKYKRISMHVALRIHNCILSYPFLLTCDHFVTLVKVMSGPKYAAEMIAAPSLAQHQTLSQEWWTRTKFCNLTFTHLFAEICHNMCRVPVDTAALTTSAAVGGMQMLWLQWVGPVAEVAVQSPGHVQPGRRWFTGGQGHLGWLVRATKRPVVPVKHGLIGLCGKQV